MKKLIYIPLVLAALTACKKPVSDLQETPTLEVEKKNMGVWVFALQRGVALVDKA